MRIASWVEIPLAAVAVMVATAGVAAAGPGDGPLISTTCSYDQLYAALKAENPEMASKLADSSQGQSRINALLALPVDQRKQRVDDFLNRNPDIKSMVDAKWDTPDGQQKVALADRVAATCHNY